MIYVLYGSEQLLIDKYIENIIKKRNLNNIIKYDMQEVTIEEILEESSYIDLFSEEKLIIVYNSTFLSSKSSLDVSLLEKYVLNQNEKSTLIFVLNSEKLDERRKIVKLLRSNAEVKEFAKIKEYELEKYIKKSFEEDEYSINSKSIEMIISFLNANLSLINTEVEKLKLYKINDKKITVQDVELVVSKVIDNDIFKLVEAVISNDKRNIFKIYKDLLTAGEDAVKIVVMLANQFRLLYQVKVLLAQSLSKNEIANKLNVHPYRIQLSIGKCSSYSEKKLLNILESLADIDYEIKTGISDKNKVLEAFFLDL